MRELKAPTSRELWDAEWEDDENWEPVENILTGRWRHGTEHLAVLKRVADGTYWAVAYRTDKDGDYNSWRDGEDEPHQVYRKEIVKVEWSATP